MGGPNNGMNPRRCGSLVAPSVTAYSSPSVIPDHKILLGTGHVMWQFPSSSDLS